MVEITKTTKAQKHLIVAIDSANLDYAISLATQLKGNVAAFKLGLEFFTAYGKSGVEEIQKQGVDIFLDLKFHDIPHTVAAAVREAVRAKVKMLTIHASGGSDMLNSANKVAEIISLKENITKPLILGVTILTSLDQKNIIEIGYNRELPNQVINLARIANQNNLDGIVCSAFEINKIKENFPDLKLIVPGIRFKDSDIGDQKRVMSPSEALNKGADFLVMGRAITSCDNPLKAIERFNKECG